MTMTLTPLLRECIICCERVEAEDVGLSSSNLKSQLLNYFAVKKLFGISEATCLYLLQNKGNPSNWMTCCKKCSSIVMTSDGLYRKLKALENKWNRLKHDLRTKICNHYYNTGKLKNKNINDIRENIEEALCKNSWHSETFTEDLNDIVKSEKDTDIETDDKYFENDFMDDYFQQSWSATCVKTETDDDRNLKTLNKSYDGFSDDDEYCPSESSSSDHVPIPCQQPQEPSQTNTPLTGDNGLSQQKNPPDANNSDEFRTRSGLVFGNVQRQPPRSFLRKRTFSKVDNEDDDSDYTPPLSYTKKTNSASKNIIKDPVVIDGLPCDLCDLGFPSEEELRNHKFIKHKKQHAFKCNLCSKSTGRLHWIRIKAHMLRKHGIEKDVIPCDFCEKRFATTERKQCHENKFHKDKLELLHHFKCNECSKAFTDSHELFRHRYGEHNLKHLKSRYHIDNVEKELGITMILRENLPFVCKKCDHQYRTEDKLKEHEYISHMKFVDETKLPFECKECDKKFIYGHQLEGHVADIHTKERNYMCEVCSRCFGTAKRLENHQRTSHGDKRFQCELCGKNFGDQKSYERHRKRFHDDPYPFRCPGCNLGVGTKSAMKKHYVKWCKAAVNKEVCDLCQKQFFDKAHLQRHKELHNKDRQFTCLTCGAEFTRKSSLQRHEECVHLRDKIYRCEPCGKEYFCRDSLYSHEKAHCPFHKVNSDMQPAVGNSHETDNPLLEAISETVPEIIPTNPAMNSEHLATSSEHTFSEHSVTTIFHL